MLIDASQLESGALLEADLCVVGGGPAGMTLALELMESGLSVVLLESGGFQFEAPTQRLYSGDETGTYLPPESEYLTVTRLRALGGTSGHWGGWCRPLDPEDYEQRPWVEHSGWPITRADLDPYFERANRMLGLPPFDDAADAGDLPTLLPPGSPFETVFFHVSALRFAKWPARRLRDAPGEAVRVVLHANLTEIEVGENAAEVTGVQVASLEGKRFRVRARAYVLATGGIENARLLLTSNRVAKNGLGNDHDLVGRFFMEHPFARIGHVVSVDQRFERGRDRDPYSSRPSSLRSARLYGCLRLSEEDQRRHRLLNGLFAPKPAIGHDGHPTLTRQVAQIARALTETEGRSILVWELNFAGEQTPNPASRVRLIEERDALRMPRVELDWRLTDQDVANVRRTTELLAAELGASLRARMRLFPERDDPFAFWDWSKHHMGTTRMAADARQGVVDADARVHGIANLYVAGSSVFATSGSSNPTLTLLALTIRLAQHLRQTLS